ncbi:MAG: acyl-CoA dehydrogenase family protein [Gaiella sp.]
MSASPDEEFRATVRAWISEHLPPDLAGYGFGLRTQDLEPLRAWSAALHAAGYAGLTWPQEYGGAGGSASRQAIVLEELAAAGAPDHVNVIGLNMVGPTIIACGTDAQKRRFLSPLLDAREIWCQGFSEPDAGSDLSALRTAARRDGDRFRLDGQKVWSSYAHVADRCLLLARTDPESQGHAGLTMFLLDMRSAGVEVRPLRQLTGDEEFNEIFLSGVEVTESDVLGEVGDGWRVAVTTLLHERGTFGVALVARLDVAVRRLLELARDRGASPSQREAIASEWVTLQALRHTAHRALEGAAGGSPGPEGSILKLMWSEASQRVAALGQELLGVDGLLVGESAPYGGWWQRQQVRSRGNTIEAGTSEILRSIVAERVLGLPRSR